MVQCKICGNMFKNLFGLSKHIKRKHNITSEEYYLKYIGTVGKCGFCGKETKFKNLIHGYQKYCNLQCSNNSEERKEIFKKSYQKNDMNLVKEKRKNTNLIRYGNEIANRNDTIKNRSRDRFLQGQFKKKLQYLKNYDLEVLSDLTEATQYTILTFRCLRCKRIFTGTLANIIQRIYKCYCRKPKTGSINENKLKEIITEKISSDKLIFNEKLNGYELDIFIPEKQIAFEYNGLYWHSEKILQDPVNYHQKKKDSCKGNGIRLIQIFEDEMIEKEEILKNRVFHILGFESKRVFARKCIIKEVEYKIKKEFLEKNHLQGNDIASINIGSYYNNELVAIMTFSKGNISKGSKYIEGEWELSRFCTKNGIAVIGVASKLLSYFKRNYEWSRIYSYADCRWSDGNLYYKLGFNLEYKTKPNYWYTKDGLKRIHRFNLRKRKDEPKHIPEWLLREREGFYRIWDCGNYKFSMINNGGLE